MEILCSAKIKQWLNQTELVFLGCVLVAVSPDKSRLSTNIQKANLSVCTGSFLMNKCCQFAWNEDDG